MCLSANYESSLRSRAGRQTGRVRLRHSAPPREPHAPRRHRRLIKIRVVGPKRPAEEQLPAAGPGPKVWKGSWHAHRQLPSTPPAPFRRLPVRDVPAFRQENMILRSHLRRVHAFTATPNSLWIASIIMPICHDPVSKAHFFGLRFSHFRTLRSIWMGILASSALRPQVELAPRPLAAHP